MSTVSSLFAALAAGLKIWQSKEATKYIDRLISLRKDWNDEYNKPTLPASPSKEDFRKCRNDAVLDAIEFELRLLSDSFSSAVEKSLAQNQ